MGGVIAIDPGKRTGWAWFDGRRLIRAGTNTDAEILASPPHGEAPRNHARACDVAIIEVPRIYPRGGKGDQNDLIDLAVLVGDLRGFYRRHGFTVRLVPPRTWKGTAPKHIHGERVLAALTPAERALLPRRPRAGTFDHNMLDAVGLGLFQLKREQQP